MQIPARWRALSFFLAASLPAPVLLWRSWMKWPDPIIDVGRDLYLPGALLRGATLYSDIRYVFPPLTPLVLMSWVRCFGESLLSFTIAGILIAVATAAGLFACTRRLAGDAAAIAVTLTFWCGHATGASTFGANFVFPYAHAATLGVCFTLWFLANLLRWDGSRTTISSRRSSFIATEGSPANGGIPPRDEAARRNDKEDEAARRNDNQDEGARRGRGGALVLAMLFAFLAAWTKLEFALVVVGCALLLFALRPSARRAVTLLAMSGAAAFTLMSVLFTAPRGAGHWLFDNVLSSALLGGSSAGAFFAIVSGTANPLAAIGLSLLGVVMYAAASWCLRQERSLRFLVVPLLLILGASGLAFRAWTLLFLLLIPVAWRERRGPLPILLVASALACWRIILNITPDWYGFALMLPLYVLMAFVLFRFAPERGLYDRAAARWWLLLFAVFCVQGVLRDAPVYEAKRFPIRTVRGTFYDLDEERASTLNEVLAFIRSQDIGSMAVIPEGLALNYYAAVPTTVPLHMFIPPETSAVVEAEAVRAFSKSAPQAVLFVTRDVGEFGSRGFGVDYHRPLAQWIGGHYAVGRQWRGADFEATLMLRSDRPLVR